MDSDDFITIPRVEYERLKKDAEAFDKIRTANGANGKKTWAKLTPDERSARAKKAVAARIAKYGQKRKN